MTAKKTNPLILIIMVLLLPASFSLAGEKSPEISELTVEKIFAGSTLSGDTPGRMRWLPDGSGISCLKEREMDGEDRTMFVIIDVPSGEERVVCIPDTFTVPEDLKLPDGGNMNFNGYIWSEAGDRIGFRYRGDVFMFSPGTGRLSRLTDTEDAETNLAFSPDGSMVSYTRENDLYFIDASGEEVRVTSTGADTLYNGVLNWVYMEELFTRGNVNAYWWAPDSRAIAFIEIDEGPVPAYPLVDWMPTHGEADMQRYPKAGDPNPRVRVGVYDLRTGNLTWLDPLGDEDGYITRVYWLGDSRRVAMEKLNRDQNHLQLVFGNFETGQLDTVLEETDSCWVGINYIKRYYESKPQFVWSSERSGFTHLYLYNENGELIRQLTTGEWEVNSLVDVDEEKGVIYFTALEKSTLERHLYRVAESGREMRRLSQRDGNHYVIFSPDHQYYLGSFSDSSTPTESAVYDNMGRRLFGLSEPPEDMDLIASLPKPEFFEITSGEGLTFQCQMLKPLDFDPDRKYPVLIYTYGGPNAQMVRNAWGRTSYLWHCLLAERGYIVFTLDNRGSYGRGRAWENAVFRQLGRLEMEDQLAGVEYLKSLPYVDPGRIGIWGWSYGGFMTCLAMCKHSDVFKAGAAVAPVVDFRLYDSIYTERYMDLPEDNESGYTDNAPLTYARDLESALFIAHGTADDNVHMQNTIKMADALIDARKDFDLMLYPGKAHGIGGADARVHLFNKLTAFFMENL